tara:strand:- start:46 stop:249 length:204 start_codon:yes stop_codon:yes gene_type:complete
MKIKEIKQMVDDDKFEQLGKLAAAEDGINCRATQIKSMRYLNYGIVKNSISEDEWKKAYPKGKNNEI